MWWFQSFNSVTLPRANFSVDLPRNWAENRMATTGGEGEYDLDGDRTRQTQQSYSCELPVQACDLQAKYDALLSMGRKGGTLRKTNGQYTRLTTAKITSVRDNSTIENWRARRQSLTVQFTAEPYWYDDLLTTVPFTAATYFSLRNLAGGPNGNARAMKYAVLTITSNVTNPLVIDIHPAGLINDGVNPPYYGTFRYGTRTYGVAEYPALQLTYAASTTASLVIDAGNSTVRVGGVDQYANISKPATQMGLFWLEPGDNIVRFNQAVTGNLKFRRAWQ